MTLPAHHQPADAVPAGAVREALRVAVRLLDLAELRQRPADMAQAHTQVARCYKALAAWGPAETHWLQALRWARMLGAPDLAVELLCDLAELVCDTTDLADPDEGRALHSQYERARDLAFEATCLAGQATDPCWEIKVLLRVSEVLDRCGDHDDAISLQTRALALMSSEATGFGELAAEVLDTPAHGGLRVVAPAALM